uniref:Overlapping protein/movement protein n=1 Tax=Chiltepin yellow mosaic virus TaxID=688701 RepID=D6CFX0_9VIRU|nr:overlapping protein/movement protein [Chiltepin yellow mosaic virus]
MSNGFPTSPRRPILHHSQRCLSESSSEFRRPTSPRLSPALPLDHPKGTPSLPHLLRHPSLRIRNHPPPPRCPQNHRNLPSLQPLEPPRLHSLLRHVHETLKVPKTSSHQPKLPRAHQLPSHPRRHRSLPHHLHHSSNQRLRLHARRFDVFQPIPDRRLVSQQSKSGNSVLQSHLPSRVPLHRSVSLPRDLHLQDIGSNTPLCAGISSRRLIQSAPSSPVLAKSELHISSRDPTLSHQAGILGPRPLPPDPKRSPTFGLNPKKSSSTPRTRSPNPTGSSATKHCSPVPPITNNRESGVLPDPRLFGTSPGHLPSTTLKTPPGAKRGLQRPLHLYKGSPHSEDVGSSRLRSHSKQQAGILLGNPKRLGQSSDLRAPQLPPPPSGMLPLFLQPNRPTQTLFRSTLASISFVSHPIPFHISTTPPLIQFQIPSPNPKATFCISQEVCIPTFAHLLPPKRNTTPISTDAQNPIVPKASDLSLAAEVSSNSASCEPSTPSSNPASIRVSNGNNHGTHSPPPNSSPSAKSDTGLSPTDNSHPAGPDSSNPARQLPSSPSSIKVSTPMESTKLSTEFSPSRIPAHWRPLQSFEDSIKVLTSMESSKFPSDFHSTLSPLSTSSSSPSSFLSASSPPRFPCYPTGYNPEIECCLSGDSCPLSTIEFEHDSTRQRALERLKTFHLDCPYGWSECDSPYSSP